MIKIRRIRGDDLKKLAELNAETFKDTSEKQALFVFKNSYEKGIKQACLLAQENGEIIGAVFVEEKLTFYSKAAHIKSIFVKKGWQRRGIGKRLMENCLEVLKKKGINTVSLSVDIENKSAISLYKKYGFEPFRMLFRKNIY
jgi:ribosomal protein S18 acetylase RimI-like enzyme